MTIHIGFTLGVMMAAGGRGVLNNHHVSSTHAKMKKGLGEPVIVVCLGLVARAETNFLPELKLLFAAKGGWTACGYLGPPTEKMAREGEFVLVLDEVDNWD